MWKFTTNDGRMTTDAKWWQKHEWVDQMTLKSIQMLKHIGLYVNIITSDYMPHVSLILLIPHHLYVDNKLNLETTTPVLCNYNRCNLETTTTALYNDNMLTTRIPNPIYAMTIIVFTRPPHPLYVMTICSSTKPPHLLYVMTIDYPRDHHTGCMYWQ